MAVLSAMLAGCITPSGTVPTTPSTPAAPTSTTTTVVPTTTSAPSSTTTADTAPTTTTPSTTASDSSLQVVSNPRHEEEPTYVVNVEIPRLDGIDDPAVQDAVNAVLSDDIGAIADAFVTEAAETDTEGGLKSELFVSYQVTLLDQGVFSVVVDYYEYWSGAAHGVSAVDAYVFDLASGDRLGLDDLTRDLDRLRDRIRRAVADEVYGGDRTAIGEWLSGQDLLDLASWAVDTDGLVVAFDQYALAAGALGVVTVHIPYADLGDSIPEGSPIAALR